MALLALGLDLWSFLGLFLFQLMLLLSPPTTAEGSGQGPVPRVRYSAGDGRRVLSLFQQKDLQDFDILLLSDDGNTLYVGARETILALNIQDPGVPKLLNWISWPATDKKKTECAFKRKSNETQCFNFIRVLVSFNATHLYACGTFAFSPMCTFIELKNSNLMPILEDNVVEGKGQSPFNPAHKHTAVLADGLLYSGTMNNFLGSEPILIRTLGHPVLKTETFLSWLQPDASFVAAIPSTEVVYFFFEETASEFDFFEKVHTSRVARVCKNDVGGEKLLQKKWTTFLKTQLLCTQPGQLPFNIIRHAVLLPANSSAVSHVYAVFTSQWQMGGTKSSAVCAFSLTDIENVFEGKYKELNKETSHWTTYMGSEPSPRPGSCSVGPSSDKALTFMKDHFLMDEQVTGTPLLVKSGVEYTQLAVETAQDLAGNSHLVMYLGTTTGSLHKVVMSKNSSARLVEEIQLFPAPEPVRNLQLAPTQGAVFAGFSGGIQRVPRANCSVYESCVDCILARDPYCAWDPESWTCRLLPSPALSSWKQDIEQGNPRQVCATSPMGRSHHQPQSRPQIIKEVLAVPNSILELPCPQLSALASYHWSHGVTAVPEASSNIYNGSLLLLLQDGVGGLYQCWATENGFSYPVVSYWVNSQDQPLALDPELEGIPRERMEAPLTRVSGGAALAAQWSYWPHFLTITVLFALVLSGALIFLLASPLGALRARGKVQGCGTLPPGEKAPLSKEQSLKPPKEHRTSASDVDPDNNHLGTEVA